LSLHPHPPPEPGSLSCGQLHDHHHVLKPYLLHDLVRHPPAWVTSLPPARRSLWSLKSRCTAGSLPPEWLAEQSLCGILLLHSPHITKTQTNLCHPCPSFSHVFSLPRACSSDLSMVIILSSPKALPSQEEQRLSLSPYLNGPAGLTAESSTSQASAEQALSPVPKVLLGCPGVPGQV
jgi:hypothetical protein